MEKDNLFTALQKYSSRENYNPIENFTTELFAWILRNREEVSRSFVELIKEEFPNEKIDKILEASSKISWETQVKTENGIADLVGYVSGEGGEPLGAIVVEIKIWASGAKEQVDGYAKAIEKGKGWDGKVISILLSPGLGYQSQKCEVNLRWSCLWKRLNNLRNDRVVNQFLDYLEDQNLSPGRSYSYSVASTAPQVVGLINSCTNVCKNVCNVVKRVAKDEFQNIEDLCYEGIEYGYMGIRANVTNPVSILVSLWADSFSCGGAGMLKNSGGLAFCIAFYFEWRYKRYVTDETKDRLYEIFEDFSNCNKEWQVYVNKEEGKGECIWQFPYFIYMPFVDCVDWIKSKSKGSLLEDQISEDTLTRLYVEGLKIADELFGKIKDLNDREQPKITTMKKIPIP